MILIQGKKVNISYHVLNVIIWRGGAIQTSVQFRQNHVPVILVLV